jgi:V8-like Glu-specific endopeptidase
MSMTANEALPHGAAGTGESDIIVDPVSGNGGVESTLQGPDPHAEIGPDGSESGEEFAEASAEDLAAPAGDDSALGDLRGIEGFDEATSTESAESAADGQIPDAGSGLGDGQEFAFLAPLLTTAVSTLASRVGPAIASRVYNRLSGRARRILSRPFRGCGTASVLARVFNEARQRSAESAAEAVDESAVDEIVRAMEVIIGTDDRVRTTETKQSPWRWICALRIEFRTGAVYRGTGFLIGRRAVATAGHCVYLHNQGGWARRIEVIPGCNGAERPFTSAVATDYRSTSGWVQNTQPSCDYGVICLPQDAFGGPPLGSFGFGPFSNDVLLAQPAVLAGYPGDKPFAELWGTARRIKMAAADQLIYDIDSVGGQSGCPVYITHNAKRYVVGIHNYGASTGNSATRVTQPVAQNLLRWSSLGAPTSPSTPSAAAGAPNPAVA